MPIAKSSLFLSIVFAGAWVGPTNAADSDIAVKDIGNDQYELTLYTSTTVNIFEAQRELAPTANKACGSEESHFGHYAFNISQPLAGPGSKSTNMTLTQTIRCGSENPPAIPQTTSAPDGWKPSVSDQSQIESETYRYYSAKDAGDYAAAYAMFDNVGASFRERDSLFEPVDSEETEFGRCRCRGKPWCSFS